jgi:hypothetical protein
MLTIYGFHRETVKLNETEIRDNYIVENWKIGKLYERTYVRVTKSRKDVISIITYNIKITEYLTE